jgi:hypothetical protein
MYAIRYARKSGKHTYLAFGPMHWTEEPEEATFFQTLGALLRAIAVETNGRFSYWEGSLGEYQIVAKVEQPGFTYEQVA